MKSVDKQFAVIGLGRFGLSVCQGLQQSDVEVLAIDIQEDKVRKAIEVASQSLVANCTSEETVAELGLRDYDIVLVAIGSDVNASILTTLVLKEAGVKNVWAKANDKFHSKILQKIGADRVIMPEHDMGLRAAQKMIDKRVLALQEIGSDLALTEFVVGARLLGKRLQDLPIFKMPRVEVLGIKRGSTVNKAPELTTELEIGDVIIMTGPCDTLTKKLRTL